MPGRRSAKKGATQCPLTDIAIALRLGRGSPRSSETPDTRRLPKEKQQRFAGSSSPTVPRTWVLSRTLHHMGSRVNLTRGTGIHGCSGRRRFTGLKIPNQLSIRRGRTHSRLLGRVEYPAGCTLVKQSASADLRSAHSDGPTVPWLAARPDLSLPASFEASVSHIIDRAARSGMSRSSAKHVPTGPATGPRRPDARSSSLRPSAPRVPDSAGPSSRPRPPKQPETIASTIATNVRPSAPANRPPESPVRLRFSEHSSPSR